MSQKVYKALQMWGEDFEVKISFLRQTQKQLREKKTQTDQWTEEVENNY